ncbi:MAG: hypothetical protein WCQ47_06130 [bacterium]
MISVATAIIMPKIEKLEKKLNLHTGLEKKLFLKVFNRVQEVLSPKYSYKRIDLANGTLNELVSSSNDLKALLGKSNECFAVICTVGQEATSIINAYQKESELAFALYADRIASDAIESLAECVCSILLNKFFDNKKQQLTRRYSPGYGDLPLEKQKDLFCLFDGKELEVVLNTKNFMIPEKSISFLVGVYSD